MEKKFILLSVLLPLLVIPVYAQETENEIPSWIKIIAGAWYNDEISDVEYKDAMEFLIENGIIEIDNPFIMKESELEGVYRAMHDEDSRILSELEKDIEEKQIETDEFVNTLQTERDSLREELNSVRNEFSAYDNLKLEYDNLVNGRSVEYGTLMDNYNKLQSNYDSLIVEFNEYMDSSEINDLEKENTKLFLKNKELTNKIIEIEIEIKELKQE